jgi:hypothetical protein
MNPKWTVLYNTSTTEGTWLGTAWEFFTNERLATERFEVLKDEGACPTRRPYHPTDAGHLAACHRQ